MRHVRTREEIIFDKNDPPVVIPKGAVFGVANVVENGIVLIGEAGFEALSED